MLAGCGGDDDDDACADNVAPKVVSVAPNGGQISLNSTITVTLSKPVDTISITLGGAAVTNASSDKKVYTFTPTKEGAGQALAITAEDSCGDSLDPAYAGVSFDVMPQDTTAPTLLGDSCKPKNGATGLDPATITEIVLIFSEPLKSATVDMVEPSENINATVDGVNVTIEFLGGWTFGNETTADIKIAAVDLAGNSADISYGFTTMAKE